MLFKTEIDVNKLKVQHSYLHFTIKKKNSHMRPGPERRGVGPPVYYRVIQNDIFYSIIQRWVIISL